MIGLHHHNTDNFFQIVRHDLKKRVEKWLLITAGRNKLEEAVNHERFLPVNSFMIDDDKLFEVNTK